MTYDILYDQAESEYFGSESEKVKDKIFDLRKQEICEKDERLKNYNCNVIWHKEHYWKTPEVGIAQKYVQNYTIWLIFNDRSEAMEYKLKYGELSEPITTIPNQRQLIREYGEAKERDKKAREIKAVPFTENREDNTWLKEEIINCLLNNKTEGFTGKVTTVGNKEYEDLIKGKGWNKK